MRAIFNDALRVMILRSGLTYREIARQMQVSPEWLCKLMARQLSAENAARIESAVTELLSRRCGEAS